MLLMASGFFVRSYWLKAEKFDSMNKYRPVSFTSISQIDVNDTGPSRVDRLRGDTCSQTWLN